MATGNSLTIPMPAFKEKLFLDLAIGVLSFEDTCWANGHDPARVSPWVDDPKFQQRMIAAKQAVEDDGRAFRARCRAIVHENVHEMQGIIRSPEVTAGHRIDAFKILAKLGELEPDEDNRTAGGAGLSLTIIAPGGEQVVINQAPAAESAPVYQEVEGHAVVVGAVTEDTAEDLPALPPLRAEDLEWAGAVDV